MSIGRYVPFHVLGAATVALIAILAQGQEEKPSPVPLLNDPIINYFDRKRDDPIVADFISILNDYVESHYAAKSVPV
ncbi:MAG TPA: hypothetical protein VNN17_12395 [Terriglobia bacterium]|nr:hypothetical protein [Terriglobia bacterium]